ncbi:microtubule-associated protein tau isoform X2 [Hyposmocoma kahamanoa]|uniref:microtubule-associated protein tau isoform X2 n=1 Tax=Hyposmocoma kahamanoa TaxID=1477025 RepID=UPI000E6D9E97|nr:microtubule-associated protein tau isoform X2 [Hyposmocoma kahamanoa]
MEKSEAPAEVRPPRTGQVGPEALGASQLPPRPPLTRVDSRSAFPPQLQRPNLPPQTQQRPQFQPGGPVTSPPQFVPRPGTPAPRGPVLSGPPGAQPRPQTPNLRPVGPQSFAPQQGPRPLQSPTSGQPPQRVPPPNNLQFGPRQPPQFGGTTTPDGARPQLIQQANGAPRNGGPQSPVLTSGQIPRQPSQGSLRGLDSNNSYQNKPVNLENQSAHNTYQNAAKPENGGDLAAMAKTRSYSIAAAPGAISPLKVEDDRRKSVSGIGSRVDEFANRSPGLGLIQEGKVESKENMRSSKESVRSEASNDGNRDLSERPESRLSGSRMTESLIGSLGDTTPKKKFDDNDDVVLQSNITSGRTETAGIPNPKNSLDRSPSLTRSDDSPELKQNITPNIGLLNKPQNTIPEPQQPKTPKAEMKQEIKPELKPVPQKTPMQEPKPHQVQKKPNELNTSGISADIKKSTPRKSASAPKSRNKDGDNDSGVDESTQGNDLNGSPGSPNKKIPSKLPTKEKSSNSLRQNLSRSSSKSAAAKTPDTPPPAEKKKVPMNKIQVGNAPSPNIKAVKSKIGSLENATYKPGGGKVKIENKKIEFGNVTPRIAAKNNTYVPGGGSKKILSTKLEWNAKSKIGSLENATYKPGGGDKKIETVKLDFKDKAKPKVASTANITHKAGGGNVKSTVAKNGSRAEYYSSDNDWIEEERPFSRCKSARAPRTPRTPRAMSPRRKSVVLDEEEQRILRNNERNRRASRPASAREPQRSACSRRGSVLSQRPAFTVY